MARTKGKTKASAASSAASSRFATPEPVKTSRRSIARFSKLAQEIEVAGSDGVEEITPARSSSRPSSFRGVYVRRMQHDARLSRGKQIVSDSSGPSSIADTSETLDYETPATSAMNTPAVEPSSSKSKVGASARALELRMSANLGTRSTSKKRKIMDDVERENNDAAMAARLQAEEYGIAASDDSEDDMPLAKRRRGSRQHPVDLTPSDDDEASIEVDDSEEEAYAPRRGRGRPSAPGSAKKSVKKATKQPMDISDISDLSSAPPSAEESDFEAEEDDDEVISIADSEDATDSATATPAGFSAPVTTARRSRASWGKRSRRGFGDEGTTRAQRERKKLEKAHPEIKTMWDDLKNIQPIKPVAGLQPETITRKLKSFQLEGLDWMQKQEQSNWKGGLLGDEMGMGKTIQAVSLIMSDYPAKQPTLVVVPPVALMQWQSEIKSYTDGKLSVLVYHVSANPKCKTMTVKDLKKFNVIMVSYSGLESMFRKESKGWNRHDGIVKEDSVLHAIKYHRLILDEAHSIKTRTTSVAKACFALQASYKWCLSGTPVQNRIGEFFSLLRFLEVVPFSCYFCKQCKCAELHWAQDENKMCSKCKHSGFNHVSVFNQEILNPITQSEEPELRKAGLAKLRLITDRIMLRRLKRDHTSSMELPPKDVVIHNEFFGEIERDFSQSIMSNSVRKFDTYVSQGVMLNNYANIFGLIMQMRQVANHPDLILRKKAEGGQNILVCCLCDEPAEEAIRSRCHHEFCRQCAKNYIRAFDGKESEAECPQCHIPLVIDWDQPEIEQDEDNVKKSSIINRIKMDDWVSSTKIETLIYELWQLRSTKTTAKSIVFSQFTSMLQLIQWRLQKSGFTTVLLDGSMSPSQRQKSIDYFMNNVDVEIFLVSLKAGGVALNLTEASKVFIVDPWWNPAAEWQSADRCHRIGQKRPCKITRLCIEDSVESRMVLLQEKKANMINGTVNNDQVALDKLTPEDMQFLFRGS